MNIKKIYTENGKVIKEYFVHKEDAKEVASKLGVSDDLVETLENILATDEFVVVENENGFSLSTDGKMVGFNIISGYLNSEKIEDGFKLGVATGSASAFSEGLATKDYVYELLEQVRY